MPKSFSHTTEDETAEYLTALAQCNILPMFNSRNQAVFEGCIFRPDFTWKVDNMMVMLECDKDHHRKYNKNKELERMQNLLDAAEKTGFVKTVFIRFNPSLPGFNSHLKYAKLQMVLANVFARNPEYVSHARSIIHIFYPEKAQDWYPHHVMQALADNKDIVASSYTSGQD